MKCEYCDSILSHRPSNGLCPNCNAVLPAPKLPLRKCVCGAASREDICPACGRDLTVPAVQPRSTPVQSRCPRCMSADTEQKTRGFSWGLAILGFFLMPTFGGLLGFVGSKQLRWHCNSCGKKW